MFPETRWYLYDTTSGQTVLKHPFRPGLTIPCPACGSSLKLENYRADCCGESFRTGFGEIRRVRPVGIHNRQVGRGWASLRPYAAAATSDVD
jgi:hypothetical protein